MILQFRKATERDIGEIVAMIHAAIDVMEEKGIFQWDDLYPAKEDFLNDAGQGQLYVGLVNRQIAVVYVLNQESDPAYENGKWKYQDAPFFVVHRFCVNPTFQNQGIAKATLQHIEKQVTEAGVHAIRLDVFSKNPLALKLYHSLGYSPVGYADWRKGRLILMEKYF